MATGKKPKMRRRRHRHHDDPLLRREVNRNFRAFEARVDKYMAKHKDEYALMKGGEVVEFFADRLEALKTGRQRFPDRLYSIQKVTKTPDYLISFFDVDPVR